MSAGQDLASVYTTGNGGVLLRGKVEVEETAVVGGRRKGSKLVITEVPYQTSKVRGWMRALHGLHSKYADCLL